MARKGIVIPVASDTRQFSKGIQDGMIEPLEDVTTSLEDVGAALSPLGPDGEKAGEKLEDAMRDAQRETEELEDKTKKLNQVIEDGAKSSYKKMAKSADDGYDKAGQAAADFKDEAKANVSEMASSFDGSLDSVAGAAQGLMGGLVANGGPIALASAGIALAGGAFYNSWKQNAELTKQAINEMYEDMKDSGKSFLSSQFVLAEVDKIIQGADGAVIKYEDAINQADRLGISVQEVLQAYAGDAKAREKVTNQTKKMHEEDVKYLNSTEANTTENAKRTGEISKRVNAEEDLLAIMDQQETKQDSAINKAKTYTAVLKDQTDKNQSHGSSVLDMQDKVISGLENIRATAEKVPAIVMPTKLGKPTTSEYTDFIKNLKPALIPVKLVTRDGRWLK